MKGKNKYCFKLEESQESFNIGGKAESLYSLYRKNIPVPKTIIISTQAFNDYSKDIAHILNNSSSDFTNDIDSIDR